MLYRGIKTKNSQTNQINSMTELLERSNSCMEIMTSLQYMKFIKGTTLDKCKVDLAEHQDWVKAKQQRFEKRNKLISDLDTEHTQLEIYKSKSDGNFDHFQKRLQSVLVQKQVIKKLIDQSSKVDYTSSEYRLRLDKINQRFFSKIPQLERILNQRKDILTEESTSKPANPANLTKYDFGNQHFHCISPRARLRMKAQKKVADSAGPVQRQKKLIDRNNQLLKQALQINLNTRFSSINED